MANNKPPSVDGDQVGNSPAAPADVDGGDVIPIKLNRLTKCGEQTLPEGTVIALVKLHPSASVAYLVDAVRNGLASPVEREPDTGE